MQKDNKIRMLEAKLGEKTGLGVQVKVDQPQPKAALKNNSQRLVSEG